MDWKVVLLVAAAGVLLSTFQAKHRAHTPPTPTPTTTRGTPTTTTPATATATPRDEDAGDGDGVPSACATVVVPATQPFGLRLDRDVLLSAVPCATSAVGDAPPRTGGVWVFLEHVPNHDPSFHRGWARGVGRAEGAPSAVWSVPNIDWIAEAHLRMPGLSVMLCKTRVCTELITRYRDGHGLRFHVVHTMWTSLTTHAVPPAPPAKHRMDFNAFLHIAGQSPTKNTQHVLLAWILNPQFPKLTVLSHNDNTRVKAVMDLLAQQGITELPANVVLHTTKLKRRAVERFIQTSGVHLCPSGVEGYGHYINEARLAGALVVTTDHPPMNELVTSESGVLVQPHSKFSWPFPSLGYEYAELSADGIAEGVKRVLAMSEDTRRALGRKGFAAAVQDAHAFQQRAKGVACLLELSRDHPVFGYDEVRQASQACDVPLL